MKTADEIRKAVSRSYAAAVREKMGAETEKSGCCFKASSEPSALRIGYEAKEIDSVPANAAGASFGCGNPLAFGQVRPGEVVVDLGSGAGLDLILAGEKTGPTGRVIGVDMTDDMIAAARQNIEASGMKHVEARKGFIEALPVEDASADWVISNCVINLSPEKGKVFAEIARVLKPGGQMLVSDVVAEGLPECLLKIDGLYTACISGAVSEGEYLEGLRRSGLEAVKVVDRVVYGAEDLRALLDSDRWAETLSADPHVIEALNELGGTEEALKRMAGKTASLRIYARKPESGS